MTHSAIVASCDTFVISLPRVDVICDLLLDRRTATLIFFSRYSKYSFLVALRKVCHQEVLVLGRYAFNQVFLYFLYHCVGEVATVCFENGRRTKA